MTPGGDEAERSIASLFVDEHVRLFNAAVDNGAWDPFVERFAEDAILEFVGPPIGPFVGRAAIYEAYLQSPPNDMIVLNGPPVIGDVELVVPYRWLAGGTTGTMRFTQQGGQIARLVVTFD